MVDSRLSHLIYHAQYIVDPSVEDVEFYKIDGCPLVPPKKNAAEDACRSISKHSADAHWGSSEGCYLQYDGRKQKWLWSGQAAGAGKNTGCEGRLETQTKNARMVDQMRKPRVYQQYPAKGVTNMGEIAGYFW